MPARMAAVLACHNRVATTLAALHALDRQEGRDELDLTVHVLDDASTDGTAERIAEDFPKAVVHHGDGHLFWNGGMREAFGAALAEDHDLYLWLNDDTELDPGALRTLLATHRDLEERGIGPAIVVGSTRDPVSGALTYGGLGRVSAARPLRFEHVEPGDAPRACDTMNGNCVLIPRAVAQRVGNLEPGYRHGLGDLDYGLRARAAGCSVWMVAGTIATCSRNPEPVIGQRALRDEWRRLRSIKELPMADWRVFARRWAGPLWPVYWLSPYVRRGLGLLRHRL